MLKRPKGTLWGGALLAASFLLAGVPGARAADPITIGFGMALTGGLAPNGKAALLAMQIWEEETNAKGGLLGRPVKLVYYDDQSNPSSGLSSRNSAALTRRWSWRSARTASSSWRISSRNSPWLRPWPAAS